MAFLLTFSGGGSATYKDAVRACKDAQLALAGATPLIVDGVTLADRERVLLRGQTAPEENGIYVVEISGGNYTLTRATDANNSNDVLPNMLVPVSAGTLNADKIFQLVSPSAEPIAVDVDPLVFTDVLIGLANKADRDLANLLPTAINQSLLFGDDTSYNIGAAGASRPQTLYVKTAINLNSLTASTFVGSSSGKDLVSLSSATATSYLNNFGGDLGAGGTKGLVPAPAIGDATRYLKGDGTWAAAGVNTAGALDQQVLAYDSGTGLTTWQYAGLGDGNLGTNNVILGRAKPTSLSGTANLISGSGSGDALTTGSTNILLGNGAGDVLTTGQRNVIIGNETSFAAVTDSILIGDTTSIVNNTISNGGVAIGKNAAVASGVAIGYNATSAGNPWFPSVAIGPNSNAIGNGVAIGNYASSGTGGIAIGYGAVSRTTCTVIGNSASADFSQSRTDYSILLGDNCTAAAPWWDLTNRQVNSAMFIGSGLTPIRAAYFGEGGGANGAAPFVLTLSPVGYSLNQSKTTSTFTIGGAQGSGTGVGGDVLISTAPAGGVSGYVLNPHVERMRVTADGLVKISCGEKHASVHAQTGTANVITVTTANYYIGVDCSLAAKTVNLPAAATAGQGFILVIKDESNSAATNNITLQASGAETIDGTNTKLIAANYGSYSLMCSGSAWFIM
jgi:hypothetical protein